MATLTPPPHYGATSDAAGDRFIARLVVPSEEIAACLDGLVMHSDETATPLLRLAVSAITGSIHTDIVDGWDWSEGMTFADDLGVLSARLPLLARVLKYQMACQEQGTEMGMAEREGWDAEIRELFVGKLPGFTVNGAERDALVVEVRDELDRLKGVKGAKQWRRELKAILHDTGRKRGTGEGCTLSTLSMPALVEWTRRLRPDTTSAGFHSQSKRKQRKLRKRGDLIRYMWIRVRQEINAGPTGGAS